MHRPRLLALLAFLLAAPSLAAHTPAEAQAQPRGRATLSGRVVDAETGLPLPGAHVYVAASTMGTTTDAEGRFLLRPVPLGAQRVRVSMMGYEAAERDTLLTRPAPYRLAVRLKPAVVEVGRLTVDAERDSKWRKRLATFDRLFLGTSALAERSVIQNPEVLDFETRWWGRFEAEAARPLVVENDALGYRLTYFLRAFRESGARLHWDGDPLFEALAPADSAQAAAWKSARRAAYRGSLRHFLRALLADRLREEGFQVRHLRPDPFGPGRRYDEGRPARRKRLLSPGRDSTYTLLDFRGRLKVVYADEAADPAFARSRYRLSDYAPDRQVSYLEIEDGPVTVDRTGEILEADGAVLYGYWAFERTSELMIPKEYQPE